MAEILDVDLLAFEQGSETQRKAVVEGTRRSLETGFVLVKTDLGENLINDAYAMLEEFYAHPLSEKLAYTVPGANGQTGYTGVGVESAAGEETRDYKEMINYGRPLPTNHPLRRRYPMSYPEKQVLPEELVPGITETLYAFHDSLASLQKRFLHVIAEGLGAHETYFDSMIDLGPTLTRSIHYPAMAQAPEDGQTHIWAGAHQDVSLITILPRATKKGLQVLINDEWQDVMAPEGYAIINKGMMMTVISNDRFPGGLHRVVADPDERGDRLSLVQFLHPKPSTILSTLPTCTSQSNPPKFSPISASDMLEEVLFNIGLAK